MKNYRSSQKLMESVLFGIVFFLSYCANAQVEAAKEDGFYVNYGRTQIRELDCYDYDNLIYTHQVSNDMFAYDRISYAYVICDEPSREIYDYHYELYADGKVFSKSVEGKNVISVIIQDTDVKKWWTAYTNNKNALDNPYLHVKIYGSIITGYEEYWNESRRSYVKTPIYKHVELKDDKIKLNNRTFVKTKFDGMQVVDAIPVVGFFTKMFVKKKGTEIPEIEKTGNCFPFNEDIKDYDTYIFKAFTK